MKNYELLSFIVALVFLAIFLFTDDIAYAVGAIWNVILSAEFGIKSAIEKGRE